jgi:hypothetical protein
MPSPFPGMNPYLEQAEIGHDFHMRICPATAEMLTAQVRPAYIVMIDEHTFIQELPTESRTRFPTVDLERITFVEIRDRAHRQLVTVIEFLSPSNKKPGPHHEQYLAKRAQILASPVHFVEIDLLRGGPRMPLEDLAACDYYALVSRAEQRPEAGIWPIRLREPLPPIPIPLQSGDADAKLDLQQVLHRIYDAAGYEDYIYQEDPQPPLAAADALWAATLKPKSAGAP